MSMHDDILKVLVSEEELKAKVAELGAQISKDYEGKNLVLVSILKGSVVFMADLMRAVSIPCSIDFMVVSSYGGGNTTSTGLVKIIKDAKLKVQASIQGDAVRVQGAKRDDLQDCIALIRKEVTDFPIKAGNFRD